MKTAEIPSHPYVAGGRPLRLRESRSERCYRVMVEALYEGDHRPGWGDVDSLTGLETQPRHGCGSGAWAAAHIFEHGGEIARAWRAEAEAEALAEALERGRQEPPVFFGRLRYTDEAPPPRSREFRAYRGKDGGVEFVEAPLCERGLQGLVPQSIAEARANVRPGEVLVLPCIWQAAGKYGRHPAYRRSAPRIPGARLVGGGSILAMDESLLEILPRAGTSEQEAELRAAIPSEATA